MALHAQKQPPALLPAAVLCTTTTGGDSEFLPTARRIHPYMLTLSFAKTINIHREGASSRRLGAVRPALQVSGV